jgi:hypothetical protein
MAYKFDLTRNQGKCVSCGSVFWFADQGSASKVCGSVVCQRLRLGMAAVEVVSVAPAGEEWVYDFTVADNHNFFANGLLNKNCVDEVDVIPGHNRRAYEEAKLIPSPWKGVAPITLYTSTRKFSFGLVQDELDNAHDSGLKVAHWNIIDVTEKCPPSRHLPTEPQIPIWSMDPTGQQKGKSISQEEFNTLSDEKKALYHKKMGYAGCLKNCKLFFACKGALATKQTDRPTSKDLLKSIDHTTGLFRKVSPGMANAQLLCKKPSEEGLIYASLDRQRHMLTAAQMASKITGDEYPADFTKLDLIALMKDRGMVFASGMDHGHAHNFAVVTSAIDGNRCFVFDVQAAPELELDHKIALMTAVFKEGFKIDPRIYGDTADPSSNKSIAKRGFHMMSWKKLPDSVYGGIEIVRTKLNPALGDPTLYFLAEDPGVELLFARMSKYHWMLDDAGRPTNIPDEENDDECDAVRYLIMNEFKPKGKVAASRETPNNIADQAHTPQPTVNNYLNHFINESLGIVEGDDAPAVVSGSKGHQGRFRWDMS